MSLDSATPSQWDSATKNNDNIDHPQHYNAGKIECIEYLKDTLGQAGFLYYLEGNVKKYLHRWRHKGTGLEDLQKARWYMNRLLKELQQGR